MLRFAGGGRNPAESGKCLVDSSVGGPTDSGPRLAGDTRAVGPESKKVVRNDVKDHVSEGV
jgi:hypothetical protein